MSHALLVHLAWWFSSWRQPSHLDQARHFLRVLVSVPVYITGITRRWIDHSEEKPRADSAFTNHKETNLERDRKQVVRIAPLPYLVVYGVR